MAHLLPKRIDTYLGFRYSYIRPIIKIAGMHEARPGPLIPPIPLSLKKVRMRAWWTGMPFWPFWTKDLAAAWVIAGEKGVYGGDTGSMIFAGRTVFTSLYTLEEGAWKQRHHRVFEPPALEQVESMFESEVPDWVITRENA
jgi:hypothetical protein